MKRQNFQLTPHFSYNEMTRSAWAEAHNVDNTPDCLQIAAMTNLAQDSGTAAREVRPHPHQQLFPLGNCQLWRAWRRQLETPDG